MEGAGDSTMIYYWPAIYFSTELNLATLVVEIEGGHVKHIPYRRDLVVEDDELLPFQNKGYKYVGKFSMGFNEPKLWSEVKKLLKLPASDEAAEVLKQFIAHKPEKEEDEMAAAKKTAAKKTGKKTAAKGGNGRGRAPALGDELKITLKVKENPKRGESAKRFAIYKSGMTVGEYIAKGGKRADIKYDVDHELITVR